MNLDWEKPIEILFYDAIKWNQVSSVLKVETPKDNRSLVKYLLFIPDKHVYIYDEESCKCLGVLCDGCIIMADENMGIRIRNICNEIDVEFEEFKKILINKIKKLLPTLQIKVVASHPPNYTEKIYFHWLVASNDTHTVYTPVDLDYEDKDLATSVRIIKEKLNIKEEE
jgi:hypothetical protein